MNQSASRRQPYHKINFPPRDIHCVALMIRFCFFFLSFFCILLLSFTLSSFIVAAFRMYDCPACLSLKRFLCAVSLQATSPLQLIELHLTVAENEGEREKENKIKRTLSTFQFHSASAATRTHYWRWFYGIELNLIELAPPPIFSKTSSYATRTKCPKTANGWCGRAFCFV